MKIAVLKTRALAVLLAGLACFSFVSGQETKAPTTESLESLRGRAEKGDIDAQSLLGAMYDLGQGVPQDPVEAFRWYLKAAEQGDPRAQTIAAIIYERSRQYTRALDWYRKAAESGEDTAQYMLGWIYTLGPYTPWNKIAPTDLAQGVKWLRRAVESDNPDAEEHLGYLYERGRGVIQDFKEAIRLYLMAADQGHSDAQQRLGMMYLLGKGVVSNPILAHMWFNIAAANGTVAHLFRVEDAVEGRDLAAKEMKPEEVERAQELARNWKPRTRVDSGQGRIPRKISGA
jgi:hypothetical protein